MSRPRDIIESIESILNEEVTGRLAIEQVAAQFSEMAREIRARLRQSVEYSRKGLRMEVRSIADARPALVETADLLISPIIGRWREYCAGNDLAIPTKISVTMIEELQCALCTFDTNGLEKLHALFRKQNLGLAAAYLRLQTLRRIAALDENSAIWAADLHAFEVQSISELRKDFVAAIDSKQLGDASEIVETLRRVDWESGDSDLVASGLHKQLVAAYAKHAAVEAIRVSQQMHANYMAESIVHVRQDLAEWQVLLGQMEQGGIDPPIEASEIIRPIAEWTEQRTHEENQVLETRTRLTELQRAVEGAALSVHEIQSLLVALEAMPGGVPDELRMRAEERIQAHRAKMRLRRVAQFVAVTLIISASIAIAVWFVRDQVHTADQDKFSAQISAAVDRGDDVEVQRLISESRASRNGFEVLPSVLDSIVRHEKAKQELEVRDTRFESLMASAGDPATARVSPESIGFAAEFARTEEQRRRLSDWREAQAAAVIRLQSARDQGFLQELRKLSVKIDAVEQLQAELPETQTVLAQAEVIADQLRLSDGIGPDARVAFDIQRSRLEQLRILVNTEQSRLRREFDEANALATVLRAIADAPRFQKELLAFAQSHPDSAYERDFRLVAGQANSWLPVIEWGEIARKSSRDPVPKQADERLKRRIMIEEFLKLYPKCVVAQSAKNYLELLQTDTTWCEWLSKIVLEAPMDFNMIETASGERYYYKATDVPPSTPDGQRRIRAVINWNKELFQVISIDSMKIKYEGPSPQSKLADKLLPFVRGAGAQRTGEGALAVSKIICDDQSVDPVVSALLMQQLLPKMQVALVNLAPEFQRAIDLLSEENLDDFSCLSPGNPTKRRDFPRIRKLVSDLRVTDWIATQNRQIADLAKSLREPLAPVGFLDHNATAGWRIVDVPALSDGQKLFLIRITGDGSNLLEEIGTYMSKNFKINLPLTRDVPSGTPIFSRAVGASK